jgi:hypothetical protein
LIKETRLIGKGEIVVMSPTEKGGEGERGFQLSLGAAKNTKNEARGLPKQ